MTRQPKAEETGRAGPLYSGPEWRADSPLAIPLRGWRQVIMRAGGRWGPDAIVLVAGGVSFFILLSAAPALIAVLSLYAMFADPEAAVRHAGLLRDVLPGDAYTVFAGLLVGLAESRNVSLAAGFFVSLGVALWGANSGMRQFCAALTIVEDETVNRSLATQIAIAAALMICGLAIFAGATAIATALSMVSRNVAGAATWPLTTLAAAFYAALLYRYGPDRSPPAWRWVIPGAVAAAVAWALMSKLFALALKGYQGINEVYGPLAGVVTVMLWVFLSTMLFLLGALINAEAERQTVRDTTTGPEKPPGERGAVPADEAGPHPDLRALRKKANPLRRRA